MEFKHHVYLLNNNLRLTGTVGSWFRSRQEMTENPFGEVVKRPDKTQTKNLFKNKLTSAVGSWFKSRQEMTLKTLLV